jgi:DNA-binding response OmpR family regulator
MGTPSLLIVDDEEAIRKVLLGTLEAQTYHVRQASNADEAVALCRQQSYDLVLTDYQMPGGSMDGLELLAWLRQNYPATDVILMTGFATMDNSILALRRGAYDYLIKPITISQLLDSVHGCLQKRQVENERLRLIAQMEAMLEQLKGQHAAVSTPEAASAGRILESSDLIIDRKKRLAVHRGQQVTLTATEFDILEFLAAHSERVVTAQELIHSVQGYDIEELDARPIVRVNIRRLRQKIESDPNNPEHILTVRKHGYRFVV